ncbi:hypothetical protein JOC37_002008 [Desulfohalotomaculum tongense]|uniref:hypothetical protein n=1 Tax=Desulforadius tongensis TaxID=1216062 RepID=UPI00195B47ED|nr:hypothetical protein [Desulforadius tongensis]MBM7855606.1 hypothetical protein [Desulforadius tongensis]
MHCEYLKGCPFYNNKMDIESALGKMYKERYCLGDKNKCARYMIASKLGKQFVPADLFPNMHARAEQIIKEN